MSPLYLWSMNLEHFTIWIAAFCSKWNRYCGLWLGVYIISANCGKAAMTSRSGSLQLSCSQGGCTQLLPPAWCKTAMYHPGCSARVPWGWALCAESWWKPINKQSGSLLSYEPGWRWASTRLFSCRGCGDVPVTQLIHKEKGWRKQLGCRLQIRALQYVAHWYACTWVAFSGRAPPDMVWHEGERKTMRESLSLLSSWEWVQGRLQMGLVKATRTNWRITGHIPNTSRKVGGTGQPIRCLSGPVVHPWLVGLSAETSGSAVGNSNLGLWSWFCF